MPVLEKEIEQAVVDYAREHGWLVLKLNNPWSRGWPDRLFISPSGRHVYIEFKRPGGAVRKLQVKRIEQLKENGCHVYVYDNAEYAIEKLDTYC